MNNAAKKYPPSALSSGGRKHKSSWAKNVGSFVPKLTRPIFEKFGFPTAALVTDWTAIAGPDIAACTMPERLTWPPAQTQFDQERAQFDNGRDDSTRSHSRHSGATLVLRVEGARALDIQFKSQQIMDRINTFFGYRAITALRIVQAPLNNNAVTKPASQKPARPMPQTSIDKIDDERLRTALKKLQEGVARR